MEARPIKLISARPVLRNFSDRRQSAERKPVGELNKGWTIAKRLLEHERSMIWAWAWAGAASMGGMEAVAKENFGTDGDRIADPAIRSAIAAHKMDQQAFGLTMSARAKKPRPARAWARRLQCSNITAPRTNGA